MTNPPEAFLSYTRLDNDVIAPPKYSLRRLLELGVQVVTADRTFNIFQDVDGIEFGQKWKKRLTEAISTSRFLIPVVTPLFFKSDPCRDELTQFIDHEKSLGRDDLILPIYFVTAPVLERPASSMRPFESFTMMRCPGLYSLGVFFAIPLALAPKQPRKCPRATTLCV